MQEDSPPKQKKPCRVCDQFKSWSKAEAQKSNADSHNKSSATSGSANGNILAGFLGSSAVLKNTSLPKAYYDCPPDSMELGRNTWSFLHTMAAYYPDSPSTFEKANMKTFLDSFSWVYPCGGCAEHLRKHIKKYPPDVSDAEKLSKWLCNTHNEVNVALGKPKFDCSKVFERWRDGPKDGRCDYAMSE
ncbi:hypothetical protein BB560_001677 [Smittium megazygosporum]|uniref:Sulfhydryl oxidase n=1 Tax=Smittium megazygosporum TaxID=133381 RepID=A0A2T9ZGW3_9FUNG|nr:hypothetical protein BB560_001677 [Smittium megazygosporum]